MSKLYERKIHQRKSPKKIEFVLMTIGRKNVRNID
jgi:hypothetical protein